ncbi:MAG: DHA2 family efflux MFS transporter permease subunit [Solirubrobacteraceae bacterium]
MAIPTPAPALSDKIDRRVWIISGVAMLGAVMSILDTTIVNVALDSLGRDLHAPLSEIQWVVTGYMLSLAAVIPVSGWAARRVGAKRVFMASLILFTIGSVLCGLATSSTEIILFRVLQGAGGGMIMPLAQLIMAQEAGPQRMGRVMSLVAVPMMLAPILGPTLGGVLIQTLGWRWIFFVNLPVCVVAVALAVRILPDSAGSKTDRLDVVGLGLMSTGLVGITYGLAEIGTLGTFDSARVYLPIAAGILLVAAFALHATRAKNPLLDLNLYRRWNFTAASITMFALGAAVFGAMILMPLYWQQLRHESVINTGLLTAPQGLGMAFAMPLAGKLTERFGGGPIALIGVLVTTVMTVPFGLIGAHTGVATLSVWMLLRGFGLGFSFMPAMTAAFATLERHELSHATPQLNVLNRVGGSIGTAILAVVLQRSLTGAHTAGAAAGAYGTAFWWSAGLSALAIIPCVVLTRAEHNARRRAMIGAEDTPDADEAPLESGAIAEVLA